MRCYRNHTFSISKYYIPIHPPGIRVGKSFNEGFSSSITKEIVATKDDSYYFAKDLKSRGYGNLSKRENGRDG